MSDIKPIETSYKGYRFRSRLEARFAVAFDHDGLTWQYEPEGFDTPSGRYLPDFRIETTFFRPADDTWPGPSPVRIPVWVEVKHEDYAVSPAEQQRYRAVVHGSGRPLAVFFGLDSGSLMLTPDGSLFEKQGAAIISQGAVMAARSARFEHGEQG